MRLRHSDEGVEIVAARRLRAMWDPNEGRASKIRFFLVHATAASLGVSFVAFVSVAGVSVIAKLFGSWQPGFLGSLTIYIAIGIAVGCLVNEQYTSRVAMWAWAPVFLWLLVLMHDFGGPFGGWREIWTNFFTGQCDSSECMYELLGTWPFFGSLGYCVGAWLMLRHIRNDQTGSTQC